MVKWMNTLLHELFSQRYNFELELYTTQALQELRKPEERLLFTLLWSQENHIEEDMENRLIPYNPLLDTK